MATASNQAQLQQALSSMEPLIEITGDFTINSLVAVSYIVSIQSSVAGQSRTLTRGGRI